MRVNVAMNDFLLVGSFEALGDLLGYSEGFGDLQRSLLDPLVEAFALDEGHRQERSPGCLSDLMNRANVRSSFVSSAL